MNNDELIKKGQALDALETEFFVSKSLVQRCTKVIDQLSPVKIRPPEQIERAIEYLEKDDEKESADLLRAVLNEEQSTWGEGIFEE